MNSNSPQLLIVTGLPGAGKTHLINNKLRQTVTGLCVHDFHGNAIDDSPEVQKSRHFVALLEALKAGHHCVIADIEFCRKERLEAVVQTFRTRMPQLNIEYHCLKNQLDQCLKNIATRNRKKADEERDKAKKLSQVYVIPIGATEYDVCGE